MDFVLDTNMIILHVANIELLDLVQNQAAVSSVTVFELLRFPGMSDEEKTKINRFLTICKIVSVNDEIARHAAHISRTRSKSHQIDSLIAATAIILGLPLFTKNTKDFRGVQFLEIRSTIA